MASDLDYDTQSEEQKFDTFQETSRNYTLVYNLDKASGLKRARVDTQLP